MNTRMLKLVVVAALGALVVGSLAGLALAKDGSHRSHKRHGHHRHHHNGSPAGTISSFDADTGVLTISLTGGDSVSGLVTRRTRIRCEDEQSPDITRFHRGEDESGDDRGGDEEAGDDHGGRGDEPGDDHDDGDRSGPGPSGHDDEGHGANCTTSDLIPGTVVEEAELELENGAATFDEVELAD